MDRPTMNIHTPLTPMNLLISLLTNFSEFFKRCRRRNMTPIVMQLMHSSSFYQDKRYLGKRGVIMMVDCLSCLFLSFDVAQYSRLLVANAVVSCAIYLMQRAAVFVGNTCNCRLSNVTENIHMAATFSPLEYFPSRRQACKYCTKVTASCMQ